MSQQIDWDTLPDDLKDAVRGDLRDRAEQARLYREHLGREVVHRACLVKHLQRAELFWAAIVICAVASLVLR